MGATEAGGEGGNGTSAAAVATVVALVAADTRGLRGFFSFTEVDSETTEADATAVAGPLRAFFSFTEDDSVTTEAEAAGTASSSTSETTEEEEEEEEEEVLSFRFDFPAASWILTSGFVQAERRERISASFQAEKSGFSFFKSEQNCTHSVATDFPVYPLACNRARTRSVNRPQELRSRLGALGSFTFFSFFAFFSEADTEAGAVAAEGAAPSWAFRAASWVSKEEMADKTEEILKVVDIFDREVVRFNKRD